MKNSLVPVAIVSVILIIYTFITVSGIALWLSYLVFGISPLLIIWMVIMVLKSDDASGRTFDEYFYDDADIKQSGPE